MKSSGYSDVDISITTREFVRMIRQAGINFRDLEESEADNPLGQYSGAGTIFGATGGVMAAVRSAFYFAIGNELADINLTPVRGLDDVKSFEVEVAGKKLRLGVVHQLSNEDKVVQEIRNAIATGQELPYHFIEVMACHGGCVSGGGQPYGSNDEIRAKRAAGLHRDDENSEVRMSHKNPQIVRLYDTYLKKLVEKRRTICFTPIIQNEGCIITRWTTSTAGGQGFCPPFSPINKIFSLTKFNTKVQ